MSSTPITPSVLPEHITISPEPTDTELAIILATFDQLWPSAPAAPERKKPRTEWRFSGRWWANDNGLRSPTRHW